MITAGVDVGAGAVKAVLVEHGVAESVTVGPRIVCQRAQRIRRRAVQDVVATTFAEVLADARVRREDLSYVASTGDGDAVDFRSGHFYTMTTHASGALFLVPEARSALDVGALHARAIRMDERGKVLGQRMTSQCASGSGQFVENIARYLGVPLEDVGRISRTADAPEQVSSICAVLAETDVINMVARGVSRANILKGIHLSLAGRLVRLVRAVGAEGTVALTGGLANDLGLVAALRESLVEPPKRKGAEPVPPLAIVAHPDAIFAGAIGAGLLAARRVRAVERPPGNDGFGVEAESPR